MKLEGERRKVKEFLERGMSYTDIAQLLGMHRHTVKALSERERNHVKKRTKKGSKLDPYKDYLLKRVQEDHVFNCEKLFQETRNQGYSGGKTILKEFVQPYRRSFIPVGMKPNQENKCKWTGKKLDCIRWMEIPCH